MKKLLLVIMVLVLVVILVSCKSFEEAKIETGNEILYKCKDTISSCDIDVNYDQDTDMYSIEVLLTAGDFKVDSFNQYVKLVEVAETCDKSITWDRENALKSSENAKGKYMGKNIVVFFSDGYLFFNKNDSKIIANISFDDGTIGNEEFSSWEEAKIKADSSDYFSIDSTIRMREANRLRTEINELSKQTEELMEKLDSVDWSMALE